MVGDHVGPRRRMTRTAAWTGAVVAVIGSIVGWSRPAAGSSCLAPWEIHDLRLAASARLPVLTTVITRIGLPMRDIVTARSLPAWLGARAGTPATVNALLAGYVVRGLRARSPHATLAVVPGRTTETLLIEMARLTPFQRHAIGPKAGSGPATLSVNFVPPGGVPPAVSLRQGLSALIQAAPLAGGLNLTLYTSERPTPPPREYVSYHGPLHPQRWMRHPPQGFCTTGATWIMGVQAGRVEPVRIRLALEWDGVLFGFARNLVVVDNMHPGFQKAFWYKTPGIRIPAGA